MASAEDTGKEEKANSQNAPPPRRVIKRRGTSQQTGHKSPLSTPKGKIQTSALDIGMTSDTLQELLTAADEEEASRPKGRRRRRSNSPSIEKETETMKITVSLQLSPQDPENSLAEGNGNSKTDDADGETRDGVPKNETDGVDGEVAESTEVDMSKATESLRIDGFTRPLPTKALQELLGKYGTVVHFWLQGIKKYCLVTYENKEQAAAALTGIDGISWPEDNRPKLTVSFIAPQEVQEALAAKSNTKVAPKESRPTKALDELFRRTKAKPAIYWLPLTEEEIAKKGKEIKKRNDQKDRSTKSDKRENSKEKRIRREKDGKEKESINDTRNNNRGGNNKRRRSESPSHSNKKPHTISQPKETKRQAVPSVNKKATDTLKTEPSEVQSNNKKSKSPPSEGKNQGTKVKSKTKKAASSSPSKSKSSSPDRSKSKKSR